MVKGSNSPQYKLTLVLGWLLVFGLPFVLITDLFPMHRFGMFARIPEETQGASQAYIEVRHTGDNWKKLETGNAYFDQGYFYLMAASAFEDPVMATELAQKLTATLKPGPDSIRLVKVEMLNRSSILPIFPGH